MKKLLVLVSIIGIAAVIGAIVVGTSTFDGTVVEKPYEKGLAWDAEQNERISSGWTVGILPLSPRVGMNDLHVIVTDETGKPLAAEVVLIVSRPSSKAYDREYRTDRDKKGSYDAPIDLPLYGYWDLDIRVTAGGKIISFRRRLFAEQGT